MTIGATPLKLDPPPSRRSDFYQANAEPAELERAGLGLGGSAGLDLTPQSVAKARWSRSALALVVLTGALIGAVVLSASIGQFEIPVADVIGSILHKIGLNVGATPSLPNADAVFWNVRFPRIVLTIIVGAALGVTGAMMQGVFGNPLAEPGVIGVSAGCAVGACAVIVFGWNFLGSFTVAFAAFVMGLITVIGVYLLSRSQGRTQVLTLVLTGIAVNAVANAAIAFFVFLGDTADREQIIFWQLGSFNGSRWSAVAVTGPLVIVGVIGAVAIARSLDLLALGERPARHLGVNVERLRGTAIVLVALLTAAAVAFCGIIAFVGLVIPHLMRMILGPSHRKLIPASVLGGALLVTLADLVARTAIEYADLPIGMLTAVVGGPFFFFLLRRTAKSQGGLG